MVTKTPAGGSSAPRQLLVPALAVAALVAPGAAHADRVDDYVDRNGRAVCAHLDAARTVGDIVRLSLIVARDAGLSLRDAASAVGEAAATDCPRNAELVRRAREALTK
jgi:hypothetical protein